MTSNQCGYRRLPALLGAVVLWVSSVPSTSPDQLPRGTSQESGAPFNTAPPELIPGVPVRRDLKAGESHFYTMRLSEGDYFHLTVRPQRIELVVSLYGPYGGMLASDKEYRQLRWIARTSGAFRIEIRPLDLQVVEGSYEATLETRRAALPDDEKRAAAHRIQFEARQQNLASPESVRASLEKYSAALDLWRSTRDVPEQAEVLHYIGWSHYLLAENQKALEDSLEALRLRRALGDARGQAATLHNLGLIYWSLNDYTRAEDHFSEALALRRGMSDDRGTSQTLIGLGMAMTVDHPERALLCYSEALRLARMEGARWIEVGALHNIGVVYLKLDKPAEALRYLEQALPLRRAIGDRRGEAATLERMGAAYKALGQSQASIDYLEQSLSIQRSIGDRLWEPYTLIGIARAERDLGRLEASRAHAAAALDSIESFRTRVNVEDLRASYFATKQPSYEFYIDLLMQMHRSDSSKGFDAEALQAAERARARGLLDMLTEARVDLRRGIDDDLLARERNEQQRINKKEAERLSLAAQGTDKDKLALIDKELSSLLSDYRATQARIRSKSPSYAALVHPQPLDVNGVRSQILDETILLEYALGEKRSFLWCVTAHSLETFELPPRSEIEDLARRGYDALSRSHLRLHRFDADRLAHEMSRVLLGPVRERIRGKRILIVPDGALHYVPFRALPIDAAESVKPADSPSDVGKQVPLIVENEVVILPSASVLAILRSEVSGRRTPPKSVVVVADPVFSVDDPRVQSAGQTAPQMRHRGQSEYPQTGVFERLAFSQREAEAILAFAPPGTAMMASGFDASRSNALSKEVSQYRIVHFATHAVIDTQNPELSGIVLSQVDRQGRPQEGFLRAHEIYGMRLSADLVVLSACRTALGKEIKGEGLVGLVRGFMYAGAPRVVASLWDVRDETASDLMKQFYEKMLKDGLPASAALRAAQVFIWKQKRWKAPYFWAGFFLQGEWR
jgi:CHAT domain-containing protein/Tfp pilus assembly protein PilF